MPSYRPKPPYPKLRMGHALAQGLVLDWPFYEGSGDTGVAGTGDTIHDLSGNRNLTGLALGGTTLPAWVAGPYGWSLRFDGSTSSVSLNARATSAQDNWTIAALCRPAALPQNDGGIVMLGDAGAGGYGLSCGGADTSNSKLYVLYSGLAWIDSGYTFADTTSWHLVLATRRSGTLEVWVDGVKQSGTSAATPGTPTANTSAGYFISSGKFNGDIAHAQAWARPLSPDEIALLNFDSFAHLRRPLLIPRAGTAPAGPMLLQRRRRLYA